MSAGALGSELLSEVKEERLDELLHSLRALNAPEDQYSFGIPALDDLISIFHPSKPTRQIVQQHPKTWAPNPHHNPPAPKPPPELRLPVIELAGATACSGKTQLLYHITATTLLPTHHPRSNIPIPNTEAAVLLFDLSSTFSILRLHDTMHACVAASHRQAGTPLQDPLALITTALQHLHIYRPHSLPSLLSALSAAEPYLLSTPRAHLSSARPLGLIALSNLTAFFWPARLEAEELALDTDPTSTSQTHFLTQHRALVTSLRALQHTFSCPILATTNTLSPPVPIPEGIKLRPHMPPAWTNFVTVKLVLQREMVPKFRPEISAEEAEKERGMRGEAVRKKGWRVGVDWWGAERWRESEREGVRGWRGLRFWVGGEGVSFGN